MSDSSLVLSDLFSKTSFLKIEFIAYEIEKFKSLYKYIYKPINNMIINRRENYTLDLSDFNVNYLINTDKLKKYFVINCIYV